MAEGKKESGDGDGIKEKKEQEKKIQDNNQNQNDNNEKENEIVVVVIKVDMHCHCQACAKKIAKALRASQGVEDVAVDRKTNTVVVKGKMAEPPMKLCDRIRHKTGRNANLLSPLPKPPEKDNKPKDDGKKSKDEHQQQQQQPQQKADQEGSGAVITVVLGVHMHCEACADLLRKRIRRMKGVESVETDIGKGEVKVKGEIADPQILVEYVHKKTRKNVSLLLNKDISHQGERQLGNHDDNNKQKKEEKQQQEEDNDNVDDNNNIIEHHHIQEDGNANTMMKMMTMAEMNNTRYGYGYGYGHHNYYHNMDHQHRLNNYDHIISSNNNNNNNTSSYYNQPQFFSDENPNACSLM